MISERIVTFSKFGQLGRLGNQVLQLMALHGIAKKFSRELILPQWKYGEYFSNLPKTGIVEGERVKEPHYTHGWEWLDSEARVLDVYGYLQSPKYWTDWKPKFNTLFRAGVKAKFKDALDKNPIAVSVRRGDFVDNPAYAQIPFLYYASALLKFPDLHQRSVIVFSDDFEYCRVHFDCLPNVVYAEGSDIEQLCLMSLCKDFVLSNSTFSYCGAMLAEANKVYRPEWIFSPEYRAKNPETDFWPQGWEVHKPEKIDLRDVTFTIPVSYDHPDRKQNLDLCVCMLQRDFDTKIIVAENKGEVFKYQSEWCTYVRYEHPYFHRTKMLNDMAKMSDTPYIVNFDCDNFIPPLQIYMMAYHLRNGADVVYPFDGVSARMPRKDWFKKFEKYLDCGIVRDTKFMGKNGGKPRVSSVGHAVAFNVSSYWDGGGENELFISFGPEDVERYERFTRLGYDVKRVKGAVYHMDHWCGPDSSNNNKYFIANHDLLKRYRGMDNVQLRKEIEGWEWHKHYTEGYYEEIGDGSAKSAGIVLPLVIKRLNITDPKIVDIGCGVGAWAYGNYYGVDYRIPKQKLLFPVERFTEANLEREFPQIKGDLVLCLEVAEHLTEGRADALVDYLTSIGDAVLFSAAIPNQPGVNHFNCQWQDYWGKKFNDRGFSAVMQEEFQKLDIEIWYRNNMVLYQKDKKIGAKIKPAKRFVLPEFYEQITTHYAKK